MIKTLAGMFGLGIAAAAGILGQVSAPPALLDDGRHFVAQLRLEPNADDVLFQATGLDRSNQLMETVVHAGLDGDATLDDWANLHRALAGQAELATERGNFGGAIVYLTMQEAYYNALESASDAALKTAMLLLDMEKRHQPEALSTGYGAMGDDLRKLGRGDEALEAYREAQRLGAAFAEPTANAQSQGWFATLWLKIVETQIQFENLDAARKETDRFLAAAGTGANGLRLRALIASADVLVAEGHYSAAIDAVKQAHALVNDRDPMSSLNLEVSNVAGAIVSATLGPLDYEQAMATAKRMQAELGDVFLVEPLAQASLLVRRRLAGDLDGVLRQLTGDLEQSRAAGDKFGQIQAWEGLAATYSGFNSRDNQIAALQQALDLTRSVLPPGCLPGGAAMAGLYFGVLDILGSAYADAGQFGKATVMFQEMEQKLALLTKARVRLYAMRHFGAEIWIGKARLLELQSKRGEAKDLLQDLLAGKAGDTKFNRGSVLEQLARLERGQGNVSASAGYYERAVAAFSEQREPNREILEHLEYARYLLTAAKIDDYAVAITDLVNFSLTGLVLGSIAEPKLVRPFRPALDAKRLWQLSAAGFVLFPTATALLFKGLSCVIPMGIEVPMGAEGWFYVGTFVPLAVSGASIPLFYGIVRGRFPGGAARKATAFSLLFILGLQAIDIIFGLPFGLGAATVVDLLVATAIPISLLALVSAYALEGRG